jgi:hypothetical protein
VLEAAVREHGARTTILRIGQIVPPLGVGSRLWNVAEAVPLMVRAGVGMGCLPVGPEWLRRAARVPVDLVAGVVREVPGLIEKNDMVVNGHVEGQANCVKEVCRSQRQTSSTTSSTPEPSPGRTSSHSSVLLDSSPILCGGMNGLSSWRRVSRVQRRILRSSCCGFGR